MRRLDAIATRRSPASPRRCQAAFTLIEVMVVMALVALTAGSTVVGLRSWTKSELRGSVVKVAGSIRYLFDRASTTGKMHRLVLDFETKKFWAEVSNDKFFLGYERETEESRQKEAEEIAEELEEKKREDEEKVSRMQASESPYDFSHYQPKAWRSKRAQFSQFKEVVLKTGQVSGGKLMSLFTPRLAQPMSSGKGYIYFFPLGQTEAAVVHLSDDEQRTIYSLVVHPLTGRVKVMNGYVEPPVEEQRDDEGNVLVGDRR